MNIYVGNLAYSVTEDDLRETFSEYGEVSSVNVITDKFSGQSKGFAFVEMPDDSEAQSSIDGLNDKPISGRPVKVNKARPREERPRRSRPSY